MNLDGVPLPVQTFALIGLYVTLWLGCAASAWLTWRAVDWLRAHRTR
ncbi:hypothetical protein [Actinomadura sp. 9N215]